MRFRKKPVMESSYIVSGPGPHAAFIKSRIPAWVKHSAVADIKRLKPGLFPAHASEAGAADGLGRAPRWLRQALLDSQARSRAANQALAKALKGLQGITQFAEPRLQEALHSHLGQGRVMDVNTDRLFYLRRNQPVRQHSLLQAALLNFDASEDFSQRVAGQLSALAPQGALPVERFQPDKGPDQLAIVSDTLVHGSGVVAHRFRQEWESLRPVPGFAYRETLPMSPEVFSQLCRSLDLGQQYQAHLQGVFAPPAVRALMIRAQKALLAVRLHRALLQRHITDSGFAMISALLEEQPRVSLYAKPVVFSQLQLYGQVLDEVLIIGPDRSRWPVLEWERTGLSGVPLMKKPEVEPVVVYIPGAPFSALKEYPSLEAFQYELGLNLRLPAYQQLFASLVPQGNAALFLQRLNHQLYKTTPDPRGIEPADYVDEVDLKLELVSIETSSAGLFTALNTLHLDRLKANARALAVPTADADSKRLQQRLDDYLGLGLDVLNVAAFLIPGAGEVMMAVMALQMSMDIYQGIESWQAGDVEDAWSHVESVALNIVLSGATGVAGHLASGRLATESAGIDRFRQIVLPNGETRLWRPEIEAYQCQLPLNTRLEPNALGQYRADGKTWVQVGRQFYEQAFDQQLNAWRIKHPSDENAYQPILMHNHEGAWRLEHEQPLQWERPTLLRRLGHVTRMFDDEELGQIGDISAVSDETLRRVHVDCLPVPALLRDTLQQWRVERELGMLVDGTRAGKHALLARLTGTGRTAQANVELVRRRFPMLSESAAQEVLELAGENDVARLRRTGRGSRRLDRLAREYAQQGRLNRALAGLYVPGLANLDSERLAIEAMLHLSASQNVVSPAAVARYATSHRREMARTLKLHPVAARPALQRINGRIGYALSGKGAAFDVSPSLISRVRDICPQISDEQAEAYVRKRIDDGESAQHIFDFLASRQRELDTLRSTLELWSSTASGPFNQRMRRLTADRLVGCWREGVLSRIEPFAYLDLEFDLSWASEFPVLDADFSHVRTLRLSADLMVSEPDAGFVKRFPSVERLEISLQRSQMMPVADALAQLPTVSELSLEADWQGLTREFMDRLTTLGQIECLSVQGALETLDVSGWPRLRQLQVKGRLVQWPAGLFDLTDLETLDLFGTSITTLPDELFTGHQQLWAGLLLDWSGIEPSTAMRAYERLRTHPVRTVDLEKWTIAYCTGCLTRFMPHDRLFASTVITRWSLGEQAVAELMRRVNGLHEEHYRFAEALEAWVSQDPETTQTLLRRQAADKIQRCWRAGISPRLGLEDAGAGPSWRVSTVNQELDLADEIISSLPPVPGGQAFAHVHRLNLSELEVAVEEMDRFLQAFGQLRELDLSRNGLDLLPNALGDLRQLTDLNLAHNELVMSPSLQMQLSGLRGLVRLNLQGNRVTALDIGALTKLESLDLSHTAIRSWPAGVFDLPRLRFLDMSNSAIRTVPATALVGHEALMQGVKLNGCQLDAQSCADLLAYAQRSGRDTAGNIAIGLLAARRTGGTPEFFPAIVADRPDLLLAAAPVLKTDEVLLSPAPIFQPGAPELNRTTLLQRVHPDLSLHDAVQYLEQMQARGMGVLEIDARLAEWNHQYDALVQRLNGWINIPGHRESGRWVSAVDRRRAADRIMQAWRDGLETVTTAQPESVHTLDFSDLCLGDIPPLNVSQTHITTLNLSGVRITAGGSQGFIREFPGLRTLHLNNNELTRLPEGIGSLENLTRLEAAHNRLQDEEGLSRQLQSLAHLEWLDLSYNRLDTFDLTGMSELQTLNLRGNRLVRWPTRVLTTPTLRTLNLSNNQIDTIPVELFEGDNDALMAHTDLSHNLLSTSGYATLRDYRSFSGNDLGCSLEDIEDGLAFSDNASLSSDEPEYGAAGVDENLDHLEHLTPEQLAEQKARWCVGEPQGSPRPVIWDDLLAQKESRGLFYLLDQLQFTQDYIQDRPGLTRRVWNVLQAAASDSQLRDELFIIGHSDVTCGDGRILLFSDLEVKVFEFNALRSVVAGQEGPALLELGRRLFRLGQVEEVAQFAYQSRRGADAAEVRLAYRISLSERLDLPAQPRGMQYSHAAKVTEQEIESAYLKIKAAENSPAFMEQLILQGYWINYLKRQYPEEFLALEERFEVEHKALEDRHADLGEVYQQELGALDERKRSEEQLLRERLSGEVLATLSTQPD